MFKQRLLEIKKGVEEQSLTTGRTFYVIKKTDAGYEDFLANHGPYLDGVDKVYNTVADGYNAMVSNRNDILKIASHGGHTMTAMLNITKNRCHFRSMDVQMGRHYGARTRLTMGVTTAATDIAVVKNTGVGNTFKGLKFDSSNTKAESLYAFAEGGEYSYFENCEFYKSTDLNVTGAAELLMNGDSDKFKDCTFGSNVNAISGAIIRPCVLLTRETITGKVCRDSMFEGCLFWRKCGNVANRFVYGANANDVERMLLFDNCIFFNTKLAGATPAQNVALGASQTQGYVLLKNCTSVGAATAMSTTTGVFIDSSVPAAATSGISVQAS